MHNGAMRPSPGFFAFPFFFELIVRCWERIIFDEFFFENFNVLFFVSREIILSEQHLISVGFFKMETVDKFLSVASWKETKSGLKLGISLSF